MKPRDQHYRRATAFCGPILHSSCSGSLVLFLILIFGVDGILLNPSLALSRGPGLAMRYRGDGAQIALLGSQAASTCNHAGTTIAHGYSVPPRLKRSCTHAFRTKHSTGRGDSEIQYSIIRLVVYWLDRMICDTSHDTGLLYFGTPSGLLTCFSRVLT